VRVALGARERPSGSPVEGARVEQRPLVGVVEVIEPTDQQEALAQVVEAQRATIEALRHVAEVQRAQLDALERGLAAAEERAERERAQFDALERGRAAQVAWEQAERASLMRQLEQAKADEARALEALRATLAKVPRWLRALLGLGAER
jgi:chromosome segregation ATPase